jgi:thioredoxin reductase
MDNRSEIAIVGAGPYGLSIAAHFKASGVGFQIFGTPMQTWREHMPNGMLLKSDGFASNISDPASTFTLKRFCEKSGIHYDDTKVPVDLDTFRTYGLAFQQRMVPELQTKDVVGIEQERGGYRLHLSDNGTTAARSVVLAVGITHFDYLPPSLVDLPSAFVTHSSAHKDLELFRGRSVAVVGGGASAIDIAALLKECGADVTLIARRAALKFFTAPGADAGSRWNRMRKPPSPIGPGLRARFYTSAPGVFHHLPQALRLRIVGRALGPAAGWQMAERFVGKVPALLGCDIQKAKVENGRVHLTLVGGSGTTEHSAEHVIAATGYRVDLRRLKFLSPGLRSQIRTVENTPILSSTFESSVPGLYFVGVAAANSFGPMMRFACGADWTARRISRKLAKSSSRTRVAPPVADAIAR